MEPEDRTKETEGKKTPTPPPLQPLPNTDIYLPQTLEEADRYCHYHSVGPCGHGC